MATNYEKAKEILGNELSEKDDIIIITKKGLGEIVNLHKNLEVKNLSYEKLFEKNTELVESNKALNSKNIELEKLISKPVEEKNSLIIDYNPQIHSEQQLKQVIRAWEENFGDFELVILGKPVEGLDKCVFIENSKEAIIKALASDIISNNVICATASQYPIAPISLADLCTIKYRNQGSLIFYRDLPFFIKKGLLVNLFPKVESLTQVFEKCFVPLELREDSIKLGVTRSTPNMDLVNELLPKKLFLVHNSEGYCEDIKQLLENKFAKKSSFEA